MIVILISENLLVSSKKDYDIACLPCNTALTGNVLSITRLAVEDNPEQVSLNANVLAVRKNDYLNDSSYKAKIDINRCIIYRFFRFRKYKMQWSYYLGFIFSN